jgi:hypothetical protein
LFSALIAMRTKLTTALAVLLTTSIVRAETLPSFHPESSSYKATHIVLVETEPGGEGKFRVVESWKGDLKKDATLTIPGLARDAKGQMVLFVRHDPKKTGDQQWQPTRLGQDWKVSVVWIDGDTASAVDQPNNPGPAFIQPIQYIKTRAMLKEVVDYYTKTERALDEAKTTKDLDKRVAALATIVNGQFDRKEEAFALLGECGPKAVPVLQKALEGKLTHDHKYVVAALANAGGKDVVPEIAKMIEAEVAYWAETGPKLEKGWWSNTDSEAWKRHGKLFALVDVYRSQPTSALRKQVLAVRDLMRNLPIVDADRGIASVSAYCDRVLKDDD